MKILTALFINEKLLMDITIIIPAFNEENSLPQLEKTLKNFKKIILIDNYSTDNTYELAKSYGWSVYKFKNRGFSEDPDLINFYLSKVNSEWIYICRADEIPSEGLIKILHSNEILAFDAFRVRRRNFLNGRRCYTWGDDYEIPIFKKKLFIPTNDLLRIGYPGTFKKETRIKTFKKTSLININHYIDYTSYSFFNAINRYSSLWSDDIFKNNYSKNYAFEESMLKNILRKLRSKIYKNILTAFIALILFPPLRFFYHYLFKGGIKSGLNGLISSIYMGCEELMVAVKCLTIHNNW